MNTPINELELNDQTIICVDCNKKFTYTEGEQRYFISKELSTPKRCPECRKSRKLSIVKGVEYNG